MQVKFREIWYNYKSEVVFLIILSAIVALSTWLARFISDALFDNVLTPVLNTCTFTVAFSGAWMLFRRSKGMRVRRYFAYALLVWGLGDLVYLISWVIAPLQVMNMGAHTLSIHEMLIGNLLGWMMLLYPTEALRPGWMTWKTALWQLLPMCALVALDYIIPLNLAPIIALYPYILLVLLFTHMRAYRIWCEENYSTLDDIDVRWLIRYCCMLILVGVNYVYMCYSHDHTRGFTQQWFVVFMMAYSIEQILFRKDPWENKVESLEFRDESSSQVESGKFNSSQDEPSNAEGYKREAINSESAQRLSRWMEQQKPYLNPDIQLADLRAVLPVNRTYLSNFIRDEFGCTFYQFVNRYRIEEAKRLLVEQPELKMADVARLSGYSSQNVFTNTFTRETGLSPREWSRKVYSNKR